MQIPRHHPNIVPCLFMAWFSLSVWRAVSNVCSRKNNLLDIILCVYLNKGVKTNSNVVLNHSSLVSGPLAIRLGDFIVLESF